MKKENRELMEQMLMAIHAKDTLEMLEELIENSDTERIDRKKLLDIIRRSPDMFFEVRLQNCFLGGPCLMPVLTTETRLSEREAHDIMEYTRKYRTDYGIIQRYVWHVIVRRKNVINKSKLNTEIQMKFSVSKRTANSVIYDMKGRYKALIEKDREKSVEEQDPSSGTAGRKDCEYRQQPEEGCRCKQAGQKAAYKIPGSEEKAVL